MDLRTTLTNPLEFVTTYEYDELGRLVRVVDAEENPTRYRYDTGSPSGSD
jgi:YD repeat-containing protein